MVTSSSRPVPLSLPQAPVILQVLPALKDGGVESSAIEMANYIKEQGWTPLVASAGGPKAGLLSAAGITQVVLPLAFKSPWKMLGNVLRRAGLERLARQPSHGCGIYHHVPWYLRPQWRVG